MNFNPPGRARLSLWHAAALDFLRVQCRSASEEHGIEMRKQSVLRSTMVRKRRKKHHGNKERKSSQNKREKKERNFERTCSWKVSPDVSPARYRALSRAVHRRLFSFQPRFQWSKPISSSASPRAVSEYHTLCALPE